MELVLIGGKLIDGKGKTFEPATIVVEGNTIQKVIEGNDYPENKESQHIDCREKTILPGMIDVHVHLGGGDVVEGIDDYRVTRRLDEPIAMHAYRSLEAGQRALRSGFTTLRDMSTRDFVDVSLRNAVVEGLVVAPRILCSGPGITMTGGHVWPKCVQVDGPEEIRKEIRRQIREGVDWIKVMGVTGGVASAGQDVRNTQFTKEEIHAAVVETHRLGRRCGAHAHGLQGISFCVEAGMDTIEHGTFLDETVADQMAAKGIYLVPTLLGHYFREQGGGDENLKKRDEELRRMGIVMPKPEQRIELAKKHGVKILAGTDCGGNTRALFGLNGIEVYMLSKCGLTNMEAIMAATGTAAEAMNLADQVGTITPGLRADLIVCDGDPLADISVLAPFNSRIDMVIKDGEIVQQT
jgi:imidazolonepropionase-like amidohydrolase